MAPQNIPDFTTVQDRLLKLKAEYPEASWPEKALQRQERRALLHEARKARREAQEK